MAGYTRQSIADIINGSEVTAPPLNAEFNQIAAAFQNASGHTHDGTTGNAPQIDLATSLTGYLPAVHGGTGGKNNPTAVTDPTPTDDAADGYAPMSMWENTTTGRVFICVGNTSNAAVWRELVQVQTGNVIQPAVHDTVDIGSPSVRFQDAWLSGGLSAYGNGSFGGSLSVSGNTTVAGALGVTGDTTAVNLTATGTTTINAGTINGTSIGGTTPSTGAFTTVSTTGQATLATADINGGTIDGAVIGAAVRAAGNFTTVNSNAGITGNVTGNLSGNVTGAVTGNVTGNLTGNVTSSGTSTFANADINGGTIDGTPIGVSAASTVRGTTVTATTGFAGNVTGNVTGNTTGTHTGNVTSASGTSTFNNLTVNGAIDVTNAVVQNVASPTIGTDAANKSYVDAQIAATIDAAPGTLDTLNELAAALGDNPNFATTVTNSIATKVSKAGDSMTGTLSMSGNKVTGLADPTTGTDAVTKNYVDTVYGSVASAAASAVDADASATSAENDRITVQSVYDTFDDRYLGAKATDPTLDNDGNALLTGALYFDNTNNITKVYNGSEWQAASSSIEGIKSSFLYTASGSQTSFSGVDSNGSTMVVDKAGLVNVFLNGVRLIQDSDYTINASTDVVTLTTGAAAGDTLEAEVFGNFAGQSGADVAITGGLIDGTVIGGTTPAAGTFTQANFGDNAKAVFGAGSDLQIYHDGGNSWISEAGTGALVIQSNQINLNKYTGENMIVATADGAVTLYHDNAAKLSTTATGVDVTGTVTADNITTTGTLSSSKAAGYGAVEVGGPSGGLIDLKAPFSDDYDARIIYNAGADLQINTLADEPILLRQGGSTKLQTTSTGVNVSGKFDATGSIAVGTAVTNGAKLTMESGQDNPTLTGTMATGHFVAQTSSGGPALNVGTDGAGTWYNSAYSNNANVARNHRWLVGGSEAMQIATSGNVGIDDVSPAEKLSVTGNIAATGSVTAGDVTLSKTTPLIGTSETTGYLSISGDTSSALGANMRLYGSAHATLADDILFRNDTTTVLRYDASVPEWNFIGNSLKTSGTVEATGGIYLGGTGAANKLDDYEEGLHNPTVTATAGAINLLSSRDTLRYVKIGRLVRVWGRLDVFSVSSPSGKIEVTLPFAVENTTEESNSGPVPCYIGNSVSLTAGDFAGLVVQGSSYLRLYISTVSILSSSGANAQQIKADSNIWLDATYTTA